MKAVVAIADLLTRSRVEAAGRAAGYEVETASTVPDPRAADVLVVDLDQEGALEAVARWREDVPETRVVGFAFHVNEDLIRRAEAQGVRVFPHGATMEARKLFV